jgi:hypothetical protein
MLHETSGKLEIRQKTKCEALNKICEIITSDFIYRLKRDVDVSDTEGQTQTYKEDTGKLDKVLGLCNLARTMSKVK